MRRVAFLSFDWDYGIVSEYYLGLQDYLREHSGVQVVIFNAFGIYYASHVPKESSFEIFSLFDPQEFDGLIVQGNRSWPPLLRQRIVDKMIALDKPVVSINYELTGAHSVGTNNYWEEYELVRHVMGNHACKRPAFVNGLKTSVEAQARLQGYRKACAQLGIRDARFYQANWQMSAGVATAKKLLRTPGDLPDVIFCCNDDLAVGVMETLQEAGVKVPEDVMIAGFDNRVISQRTTPRITTVDRDYRTIAVTALTTLLRLINGESLPRQVFSPAKHVLSESCGYSADPAARRTGAQVKTISSEERFYEVLNNYQPTILASESLYSVLENCEMFAREMDCPNAFLALSDAFLQYGIQSDVKTYSPISRLVARKGNAMTLRCDDRHIYTSYATRKILPPEVPFDRPLYMVSPLRHNEMCIGMVVTEGVPNIMHFGFNVFFLTTLASSLAAVRKKEILQTTNAQLGWLHVRDELTGLFNQRGLESFGRAAYKRLLHDFGKAWLTTIHIEGLQGILAAHGAKTDRRAIRDAAGVVRSAIGEEDVFAMRTDDGRFLLISHNSLVPRLEEELKLFNDNVCRTYTLRLDITVRVATTDDELLFEEGA